MLPTNNVFVSAQYGMISWAIPTDIALLTVLVYAPTCKMEAHRQTPPQLTVGR